MLTTLLLLPLTPFLHRFIYQVPAFLFFIFVGCLIYNLLAFPFSRNAHLKFYFVQNLDLNTGVNNVTLIGLNGYLQDIISDLPSAAGQPPRCGSQATDKIQSGVQSCVWHGIAPNVMATERVSRTSSSHKEDVYKTWLDYNITSANNSAQFSIQGRNTKSCRLVFDQPVSEVYIEDAATDPRYHSVPDRGSSQIRLFGRDWDKNFKVNVTWSEQQAKNQTGKVMCMWSDANQLGTIPAYDELRRFAPVWSAVTKMSDGLVEGWKEFTV